MFFETPVPAAGGWGLDSDPLCNPGLSTGSVCHAWVESGRSYSESNVFSALRLEELCWLTEASET